MKSTEKCNSAKNSLQWLKNFLIFGDSSAGIKFKNLKLCPKGRDASNPPISALHLQLCSLGVFLRLFWTWGSSYDLEGRNLLKNEKSQWIALGRYSIISLSQSGIFSSGKFFSFPCWGFLDVTLRGVVKIILDFSSGRESPHWPIGRAREKNLLSFLTYWMLSAELEFGFFAPREHQPKIEIS